MTSAGERIWGATRRAWFLGALAAALALRLGFAAIGVGVYYPDELFQYLEPAWWHLHGFGSMAWEYERGIRNWVLPSFYGGLIQIGEAAGLQGWALRRFLSFHDAVFSVLLVPAGFRLGMAAGRGDLRLAVLAGWACALFPLFAYLAPHTLSDNHGLLVVTWAYALWLESIHLAPGGARRAVLVGLLLALAFIMRYSLVVFWPVLLLGQLFSPRRRELPWMGLGLLMGLSFLGLVDAVTWGSAHHSTMEFAIANRAGPIGGASPPAYYLRDSMWSRQGAGIAILAGTMPLVFRRQWRLMAAWMVPLAAFSALPHKEDRFILAIWPFFLTAGLAGLLCLRDRVAVANARLANVLLGLALAVTWVSSLLATAHLPRRLSAGILQGQTEVGRRDDATGLLVDGRPWWAATGEPWLSGEATPWWHGGHLMTPRNIPISSFRWELVPHPLFNYVLLGDRANAAAISSRPEFEQVARYEGGVTLFRRR